MSGWIKMRMESDADYREMLSTAIAEMLRDIEDGDTWRATSIGKMALLLDHEGPQSQAAADHIANAALEALDSFGSMETVQ